MVTLNEDDRARMDAAIKAAEAKTSAEIVVMIAEQATHYRLRETMAAAVIALALPAILLPDTSISALTIWLAQIVLFTLLAFALPALRVGRFLVGRERRERDVRAMAEAEFFAHGLRRTKARAAVLIFVALREHQTVVLYDDAAAAALSESDAEEIARQLAESFAGDRFAEGVEAAAQRLGNLLEGPLPPHDEARDELPNIIVSNGRSAS
jgi:putative membrane protein